MSWRFLWLDVNAAATASSQADSTMEDEDNGPIIFVSQACLLIPVFVAAWWYYTKYACRAFVRGLLRNGPEQKNQEDSDPNGHFARMEEAYFQSSWVNEVASKSGDDTACSAPASTPSNRFVKWINRRNVRRQFEKEKVKRSTQNSLFRGSRRNNSSSSNTDQWGTTDHANITANTSDTITATTPKTVLSDKSLLDTVDEEDDDTNDNLQGNGIEQQFSQASSSRRPPRNDSFDKWECIPRDSHIELCTIPHDQHEDGVSI